MGLFGKIRRKNYAHNQDGTLREPKIVFRKFKNWIKKN